jgi:hypothetical protein
VLGDHAGEQLRGGRVVLRLEQQFGAGPTLGGGLLVRGAGAVVEQVQGARPAVRRRLAVRLVVVEVVGHGELPFWTVVRLTFNYLWAFRGSSLSMSRHS